MTMKNLSTVETLKEKLDKARSLIKDEVLNHNLVCVDFDMVRRAMILGFSRDQAIEISSEPLKRREDDFSYLDEEIMLKAKKLGYK